jgi:Acetyltransferase (GNAT) domain
VRAFWDDGHRRLTQVRAHDFGPDPDTVAFVFTPAGRAAGYLQSYPVCPESEVAHWRSGAGETWGLDLLLGEATDTGRGHGPAVIGAFPAHWRAAHPESRGLLIDPDVRTIRVVRAYRKAGFVPLGEHAQPPARLLILALDF